MTEGAKRVAAFCNRVIEYGRIAGELRHEELGALEDAELAGVMPDAIAGNIRAEKIDYYDLYFTAKNQVYNLVTSTKGLTAKQARIIDLRFRKGMTWEAIRKRVGYSNWRCAQREAKKAYEKMAPVLDRLYPDYKIGDP